MIVAKLIGESSAGDIIVQIYDNDMLVWAHSYTSAGCSSDFYESICREYVFNDMVGCAEYAYYDGCDVDDDDGNILDYLSCGDTYGVVAEFCSDDGEWTFWDNDYGMTGDVMIGGRKVADIINNP